VRVRRSQPRAVAARDRPAGAQARRRDRRAPDRGAIAMSHRVVFRHLKAHLDEVVSPPTYDTLVAYVLGYDAGTGGIALAGFLEWVVMKAARPSAAWPSLVADLAFDGFAPPRPFSPADQRLP